MNIRDQKTEKTKSEFVTGLFGIVVIITIGFLLPSLALAQETGNSSFTEEECTAISRTTGQNLIYYPPGCNIVDTDNVNIEYIDKIEDVSILRSGLDRERNTLLRFSDPAKAKTHMDEVVALLLETHYVSTTDDKYKALPYNKETVMIGDGGTILIGETSSHVNRIGVIKDSNLRDFKNGWISEFQMHLVAQKGSCVIAIAGQTSLNPKQDEYHSIRYDRSDTRKNITNVTGFVINEHPGFDHGRARLLEWVKGEAVKLEKAIEPYCGDSAPVQPATNVPANNAPDSSSPYAACAIKCLDDAERGYQCPLPASEIDDNGVSVIQLPNGSTRNFSPRDNECVDDRSKAQNDCLSGCPASVGGEPIPDPMGDGQPIKVAGAASDDPLNEAEKYINLLKRKPAFPNKEEYKKKVWGNYEGGKPMSVWSVEGEPEMQVPGSDEWVILKKGDAIPKGARIFTGMDDDIFVVLPGSYVVKVRGFSDITFDQTGISKALGRELINHLDLRNGDVEVIVEPQWNYQGSMQVKMPAMTVGVRGTHFWVSYDEAKRLGAVGVYKGEVAVDDLFRGTRTLLTPAKDETPRVIVMSSADSASLQDQKSTQGNSQLPTQKQSNSGAWWIVLIIVLSGGVFILHKTGKLWPILQKILTLIRRDKSKQF